MSVDSTCSAMSPNSSRKHSFLSADGDSTSVSSRERFGSVSSTISGGSIGDDGGNRLKKPRGFRQSALVLLSTLSAADSSILFCVYLTMLAMQFSEAPVRTSAKVKSLLLEDMYIYDLFGIKMQVITDVQRQSPFIISSGYM